MAEKESDTKATILPIVQVEKIMRSAKNVEDVSADSIYIMAKAAESFVGYLAGKAWELAQDAGNDEVDFVHFAKTVNSDDKFVFLEDILLEGVKPEEYLDIIEKVEAAEAKMLDDEKMLQEQKMLEEENMFQEDNMFQEENVFQGEHLLQEGNLFQEEMMFQDGLMLQEELILSDDTILLDEIILPEEIMLPGEINLPDIMMMED